MVKRRKKKIKHKLKLDPSLIRWFIVSLVFLICVFSIFLVFRLFRMENMAASDYTIQNYLINKVHSGKAWIEFDFNNGKKRKFEGEFERPYPLSDVLNLATQEGKIKLIIKDDRIDRVDNLRGGWRIYRNSKFSGMILKNLKIEAGDKYRILYQK